MSSRRNRCICRANGRAPIDEVIKFKVTALNLIRVERVEEGPFGSQRIYVAARRVHFIELGLHRSSHA